MQIGILLALCVQGVKSPLVCPSRYVMISLIVKNVVIMKSRKNAEAAKKRVVQSGQRTCSTCGQMIDGEILSTNNQDYHPSCFLCSHCGVSIVSLGTMQYAIKDDKPVCPKCVEKMQAKVAPSKIVGVAPANACERCHQQISGGFVMAEGHKYHSGCFVCENCKGELQEGYTKKDNKIICVACASASQKQSSTTTSTFKSGGSKLGGIQFNHSAGKAQPVADPVSLGVSANNSALKSKGATPSYVPTPASAMPGTVEPVQTPATLAAEGSVPKFCGSCGSKVVNQTAKFCAECGCKF